MLHLIYNPIAGKGKSARARRLVEEKLGQSGVAYRFYETSGVRDAQRIARTLTSRGARDIVVLGGDGTVHETLNGLEDPGMVHLGVIPCGSGNDFALAFGIPADPEKALELVIQNSVRATDYLECSGVRGLNVIGAGIDVEILQRCYRSKFLKGSANYFASLIVSLLRFVQYRFTSERDGRRGRHEGLIVCACNGQRLGGGIAICPQAACDDGLLDVVIVQDVKKSLIPGALLKLMRGKILMQPYTLHERAKRLCVTFEKPTPVQVDGEIYEDLPFDVRVVSGKLRMFRP